MAASLVESLGADFDASQFHDEYREAVAALIERKGDGRCAAPVAAAPAEDAGEHDGPAHGSAAQRRRRAGGVEEACSGREPAPKPARRASSKKKADEEKPAARKRTRKPA